MRLVVGLILTSLVIAGCLDDPAPQPAAGPDPEAADPVDDADPITNTTAEGPIATEETIPVHFNGTLGTYAYLCEFSTDTCVTQDVVDGDSDIYVDRPGTVLQNVSLTLRWEADTPFTETLFIGAMVMGLCDTCNTTMLDRQEGTSPLTIDLSDLDITIPEDHIVHAYVYNPTAFAHQPPIVAYASSDQAIQVDGAVTVAAAPVEP